MATSLRLWEWNVMINTKLRFSINNSCFYFSCYCCYTVTASLLNFWEDSCIAGHSLRLKTQGGHWIINKVYVFWGFLGAQLDFFAVAPILNRCRGLSALHSGLDILIPWGGPVIYSLQFTNFFLEMHLPVQMRIGRSQWGVLLICRFIVVCCMQNMLRNRYSSHFLVSTTLKNWKFHIIFQFLFKELFRQAVGETWEQNICGYRFNP